MSQNAELKKLLYRAFKASSATRLTRTVQGLAIMGTAAGLALILLGSSIVDGFQWEIPQRMGQFWGHLQVRSLRSEEDALRPHLSFGQQRLHTLQQIPGVRRVSTVILLPGLGRSSEGMEGVLLKGVQNDSALDFFRSHLVEGQIPSWSENYSTQEILIPKSLATALRVQCGDDLSFYFMQQPVRMRKFKVSGIFQMPMQNELGRPVAVVHQSILRKLLGWSENAGGHLEMELMDHRQMTETRHQIDRVLTLQEECITLEEQMPALFEWLRFFDTNRVVLMILLVIVGAVNLISALLIIILERQRSLGILQIMGLRPMHLAQTTVWIGLRLVFRGLTIGNLITAVVYFVQNQWKLIRLDPESYYLDYVPLKLDWQTYLITNLGAILIALIILCLSAVLLLRRYADQNLKFS
ncbi:MAG: ABC transporter permease [Bacteroidetes bacterium]|nr:ABC transporter permease [Bacteroidota bacterium]